MNITIDQFLDDLKLGRPALGANPESWNAWRVLKRASYGLPPRPGDLKIFQDCTGRIKWPKKASREVWINVARRCGKTYFNAIDGVYISAFRKHRLSPGEVGYVALIAPSKAQGAILKRYVSGILASSPMLANLIESETANEIRLKNRISIAVIAGDFKLVRGFTLVAAIIDEVAFFNDAGELSDVELLRGVRPGLQSSSVAGMLICSSSPLGPSGELYKVDRHHFGVDDDPILVWRSNATTMNPLLDEAMIRQAYVDDPVAARSEWGGLFRLETEGFFSPEIIAECVERGRGYQNFPSPPALPLGGVGLPDTSVPVVFYSAFVDMSGGSIDSSVLAIASCAPDDVRYVVHLDERRPPFSPEQVVEEFCGTLKSYGIASVAGDAYGGVWVREAFTRHGIEFVPSAMSKSEIYLTLLSLINSGKVVLPNNERLIFQLLRLQRRLSRSGRDSIDTPQHESDDLANAAAGALVGVELQPSFAGNPMELLVTDYPGGVTLLDRFSREFPFD